MVPLAVSGQLVIGAAVAGAVLLLVALLRAERRYEAEDEETERRR